MVIFGLSRMVIIWVSKIYFILFTLGGSDSSFEEVGVEMASMQ